MNKNASNNTPPADGLKGFKQNIYQDSISGFLVFLLALPLSLGIAKASSFPMLFGLVTAIVGGILVTFFMGSRLSIKGPAAGLIVIASGAVEAFGEGEQGWHLAAAAIVVAGLLQVLFGYLKAGKLADFFPSAAIHGMLAAIGIIIMAKQLHMLLGIDPAHLKGKEPLELLAMLPDSVMHENAHLAEIGIACLAIMIAMSFIKHEKIKKIPAPLIVLIISIPLGFVLHIKTDGAISNFALVKIGSLRDSFSGGFFNADFTRIAANVGPFIEYVILFSLIGSLESLLTAKAVDGMDPWKRKTDYDKDLIGVGIGNIISGLLGGLPMISEVARSSANVGYGARTRWSNFFHGVFLLIAILFAVPIIEMIPNVALAAMLVFVGFRLAHPKHFIHAWHIGKEQLLVFATTVIVTISTDLLIGVGTGIVLEMGINFIRGAKVNELFKVKLERSEQDDRVTIKVNNCLLFSNILPFKKNFQNLEQGKEVVIDFSDCRIADHTALVMTYNLTEEYARTGGNAKIIGLDAHQAVSKDPTSARIAKPNKTV